MTSYKRLAATLVTVVLAGCVWMTSAARDDMCEDGRTVIVHLFNWRWDDIATECEQFLGPNKFCGVQVSPPNEHINSTGRQWWERYQPVSYKIASRSGSKLDFEMMVRRCKNVGVRIFVDVVINHMASAANAPGFGIDGNWFDPIKREFPEADDAEKLLYDSRDFNRCHGETGGSGDAPQCPTSSCNIENYEDATQVRYCRLESLLDLATSMATVRNKITYKYLNPLIKIGVAGFRIDAAKHMNPEDISRILRPIKLRPTVGRQRWFEKDTPPYVYLEVIDKGGEPIKATDYFGIGRVRITEFKACDELAKVFRRKTQLQYLRNWGEEWNLLPSDRAFIFVDNHDNQRGHGGGGSVLTHKEPREYKMATAFMLAHEYGFTRVMSSYYFSDRDQGPPYLGNSIAPVVVVNGSCTGGWVCEHRWIPITNMVKFRNIARGETITHWWDNEGDQIAFCRGDKACIAFNNDPIHSMDTWITTSLPAGVYCDIITGDLDPDKNTCTGRRIIVDTFNRAHIKILPNVMDSMEAIHIDAREWRKTTSQVSHVRFGGDYQRTVVFIRYEAETGQDVFIRGGTPMADGVEDFSELCTRSNTTGRRYCPIEILYSPTRSDHEHFDKFRTWADGDDRLDWDGVERYQRVFYGPRRLRAAGSPLVWSTNRTDHPGYQPENRWGDHYWMWDVLMDCSQTRDGWFEFKTFVTHRAANDGWEADVEVGSCNGTGVGSPPIETWNKNHVARCGYVNQFVFNSDRCTIDKQSCGIQTTSGEKNVVTKLLMDESMDGVLMAGESRCYELRALKSGTLQVTSQNNDTEVEVCVTNTTGKCVIPSIQITPDTVHCQLVASDWQLNVTAYDRVCLWVGGASVGHLNDFTIVFVSVAAHLAPPLLLLLLCLAVTQLCRQGLLATP